MIDAGEVEDRASLARRLGFGRAHATQFLDLLLLALDIQKELLFTEVPPGCGPITEHDFRRVSSARCSGRTSGRSGRSSRPGERPDAQPCSPGTAFEQRAPIDSNEQRQIERLHSSRRHAALPQTAREGARMTSEPDAVLTIDELAGYLKIAKGGTPLALREGIRRTTRARHILGEKVTVQHASDEEIDHG